MVVKEETKLVCLIVSVKILQSQYFVRGVESLCIGFSRTNLQKASCGLTSLHQHWKTTEHQMREKNYRLQHDNPLVKSE